MTVTTTAPIGTTGVKFAPTPTPVDTASATARLPKKQLDKDAFLQLLVTQLKNQDPLNPSDPQQMAAQLAQFSTVEQLTQVNKTLQAQSTANAAATTASQTVFGSSLIGQNVVATGSGVAVAGDGTAMLTFEVPTGGGTGTLTLKDASGSVVTTRALGELAPGLQQLPLTGLTQGSYTYSISVAKGDSAPVAATTYIAGTVDALQFVDGVPVLRVKGVDVPLGTIVEVHHP